MTNQFVLTLTACFFLRLSSLPAQTPAASPNENPEGDTGALKSQITTGGSYDAHSGNATRIVTDLHLPGALGVHGLDFTRYWNSTPNDHDNGFATAPSHFGASGWSHSWDWHAEEEDTDDKIDPMDDNSEEIWTTAITITFPDGHASRYKITRSNRWHVTAPPDPRCGPPYTVPEQNGFLAGGAIYDVLRDMAADGSEFWLYQADGSAVHFIGGPGSYQASEVFDPHGLKTDLHYNPSGDLEQVIQEGGRWITINWGYYTGWGREVITSVVSGGYAGAQSVQYTYGWFPHPQNSSQSLALTTVSYPEGVWATYNYEDYNGDPYRAFFFTGPRLLTADDPRFAGPMTKIRYSYRDSQCAPWEHPQSDPPTAHLDYFYAQGNSIAAEQSGDTGEGVSSFSLGCWTGTRMESSGLGGWRMFYFGHSAGYQGSGEHLGYQLIKLTDFTNQYPFPANLPFERQNWLGGQAHQVWDGRGIQTDLVVTPWNAGTGQYGDSSGQPSEVHHTTADGSIHRYDRVNPGASDARDPARIHSPFNHWVFSQTDERGLTTTYRRDSRRRVVDIYYPDTNSEHFAYNDLNQVVTHTLPSGAVVTYDYDPTTHRLLREYSSVDGPDPRKEYIYDDANHPDLVHKVIDGRSRTSGAPYSTRMEYDGANRIMEVHYAPTPGSGDPHVSYGYDTYGNCTSITDEMGHTSTYTYDSYRRCTSYVEPLNAPDANGTPNVPSRRWDWLYDRWIDVLGPRGSYTHTKNEWRIQIEPAFNYLYERRMTARAHDLQNRVVIEQTGWIQRPTWIGDWYPSGDLETHYFSYDANGNKSSYTDPMGRVTSYTYDNRNRLWQTIEPLNRVTQNQYDVTSNKTVVTFPDNTTQQWLDFTPFGQAERFIDERGNTTNLNHQWGPMKKLASVVTHRDRDDGGTEDQTTTFSYDGMGRPTQVLFPDGSYENNTYECQDNAGYLCDQVHTWRTRKGQVKTIQYDARGRESSHTWNDGQTPAVSRTWDPASRLTSTSNSVATVSFGYDDAAQLAWESDYVGGAATTVTTSYLRYADGSIWNIQYPNGMLAARSYTARGQLQTVWEKSTGSWRTAVNYNYNADGKVEHQDYGNGTTSTFGYDGRGFTSSVSNTHGGTNLSSRTYYRDARDRIVAWQKSTDNGSNPMEDGRGNHYYYDGEGELTDAYYGAADPLNNPNSWGREDHFNYDALGNRRSWDYIASRWQWMNFTRKDNGLNQYRAWWPYSWVNYDDDIGNGWGSPGLANGVIMQDGWITAGFNALNQPMYIWSGNVGSAQIRRLFYVGFTRARH
jgi:YD repeat-containing protein